MKILLVNVTYKIGSTGNIVYSLKKEFEALGHDVFVLYGRKKNIKEKNVFKCCFELESKIHHFFSLFSGNMLGGMPFSTLRAKRLIKKIKPEIIHLHCLNGYFINVYKLIKFLNKLGTKIILTNHAEFMYTGGCAYIDDCEEYSNSCNGCKRVSLINGKYSRNSMSKNYKKIKHTIELTKNCVITGVSPWITDHIKKSEIFRNKNSCTVLNGVDSEFLSAIDVVDPFAKFKKEHKKIVFCIIPNFFDYIKGGFNLYEIARLCSRENIQFVVAGAIGKKMPNITYLGNVANNKLANYYYHADKTLLLSKRESFSMVVAESLLCGTSVLGFKAGGPESIAISDYCNFVDYGDFESIYKTLLQMNQFDKNAIMKDSCEIYSSRISAINYLKVYKEGEANK